MKHARSFFYCLLVGVSACQTDEFSFGSMESAESTFSERQQSGLLAYMPLESIFSEEDVRALSKAAGNGNLRKVEGLIARGVDVNSRGAKNATPLFWSMREGNLAGYGKLLQHGADPNIIFGDGGTVVHWTAKLNNTEFLRLALEHGGDPNLISGTGGETPLFDAIGFSGGNDDLAVSLLLDYGANPDIQDSKGNTPTMVAAAVGRFDLVYTLLLRGANCCLTNKKGYNLVNRVESKRNVFPAGSSQAIALEKVVRWLSSHGAGKQRNLRY